MIDKTNFLYEKFYSQRPQINLARSTAGRMWLVNLCALMVIIQSSITDSYSSLLVALAAAFAAALTEFILLYKKRGLKILLDGSAVASALILTLLLPNKISPGFAAAGAVFAIAVIKHSFGGLGSNWLNPAAGGWLFIRFSWPAQYKNALEGSPLSLNLNGENLSAAPPLDGTLASFLNRNVFSIIGVEIPSGYTELFAFASPGIIADRGVFALLLGTLIITAYKVSRSWIPAVFLVVFCFFVRLAGSLHSGFWEGNIIYALFSGGTLVAAFLLTADPATGAKSNKGMLLMTVIAGIIAFAFRYLGKEPYGVVFAIVLINAILPLVRILESRGLYKSEYP